MQKFFFAALFFCTAANAAPGCAVPAVTGKTYHQARAALIEKGFTPESLPEKTGSVFEPWTRYGYREIDDCAPTGSAPCLFRWKDGHGRAVTITTAGEDAPPAHFAKVRRAVCD